MKYLPASDASVKKAKGWNELSPAENTQNYKRAISVMLRARRTRRRTPAWRGWRDANRWQQGELLNLQSVSMFCQEGWDAFHKGKRGHRLEGTEIQNMCCDCQSPAPSKRVQGSSPWWIKPHASDGMGVRWQKYYWQTLKHLRNRRGTSKWKRVKTEVLPIAYQEAWAHAHRAYLECHY